MPKKIPVKSNRNPNKAAFFVDLSALHRAIAQRKAAVAAMSPVERKEYEAGIRARAQAANNAVGKLQQSRRAAERLNRHLLHKPCTI